ncbi:MAG: redoxin domain-containing protein [Winogradskyella sp.]|nr:redoxin domain-containing protein [Winogradskyella sp.]
MKHSLLFIVLISVISCTEKSPNYATLSGKISNPDSSLVLKIYNSDYAKDIELNEDGTFNDTLHLPPATYELKHGNEYGSIYLENGYNTSFTTDYNEFDKKLVYNGDGSDRNNFSIQSYLISGHHITQDLFETGTEKDLNSAIQNYMKDFEELTAKYEDLDSTQIANGYKDMENNIIAIKNYFESKQAIKKALPVGSPSPEFTNYTNVNGGTTSLSDLRGKYLYIDIWATWCQPCLAEIPSLKLLESEFQDRNIEFVSISIDDGRGYRAANDDLALAASTEGWKKMIVNKQLGGVQLLADEGWESDFIRNYKINGIPRFIIIDPNGHIVSPDALRPSNEKLIPFLKGLDI